MGVGQMPSQYFCKLRPVYSVKEVFI